MNTVPGKVLDVFTASTTSIKSFTNSNLLNQGSNSTTDSFCENTEKIDIPNEYRNLLISLSGQKSDHILWIECLKQYYWESDESSEFLFALDKFGVPSLKNGNYKLNLCHDCLDMVYQHQSQDNVASPLDGFSFLWEGNYWDSRESLADDFAYLSAESIYVVVKKCANILNRLFSNDFEKGTNNNEGGKTNQKSSQTQQPTGAKGRPILVYMPNVVQFFVIQMAAARVGAILTFVNAAINRKVEDLAQLLEISQTDTVFTVDGFFMGETLQQTKQILDKAIDLFHSQTETQRIKKVIVVRHVGSNPNIPFPSVPAPVSRRPHYGLDAPFQAGRDFHWSDLMLEATEECKCEWMQSEDILFNTICKIPANNDDGMNVYYPKECSNCTNTTESGTWHFQSYTVGQIALLVRLLSRTLRSWSHTVPAASGPIWPLVESDDLLFLSCMYAIPLAGFALLICESPPTHPNPSRIFEIIHKHSIKQLLIAEKYTKLLIRNDDFENVWHQENDPKWSSSSLEIVYTASRSRHENENYAKWLQECIPTANILHLSC